MGFIYKIWKSITGPLGVLENWANEPLNRWQHQRTEQSKDKDVERRIREQTGVAEVNSRLQQQNDEHRVSLEIRMQTEINRINAETEQWSKDQEFIRMQRVADAMAQYQERLTSLNLQTVRAIGEMDIELRSKAQALILEKTNEYRNIQSLATRDAEEEFERILKKFSSNERVLNIMISNSDKKLAAIVDSTTRFMEELSIDIQNMNKNIDNLIQIGHEHTLRQLDKFNSPLKSENTTINSINEVEYKELSE